MSKPHAFSKPHAISIVAAERGSVWAPWVNEFRRHTPGAVELIVQRSGESGRSFASRVRRRTNELIDGGATPAHAAFVGAGGRDAEAMRELPLTVRALAACIARARGGRLYLDGLGADRIRMTAIADAMSEVEGANVVVAAQARESTAAPVRSVAHVRAVVR